LQRYDQTYKNGEKQGAGKYFFEGNSRREAQAPKKRHLQRGNNQRINKKNKRGKERRQYQFGSGV